MTTATSTYTIPPSSTFPNGSTNTGTRTIIRTVTRTYSSNTSTAPTPATTTTSTVSSPTSSLTSTITSHASQNTASSSTGGGPTSSTASSSTDPTTSAPTPGPAIKVVSAGVSHGAAAGIGIGCAVIGALLAVVILLLMGRRQKSSRSSSHIGLLGLSASGRTNSDGYGGSKQQKISEQIRPTNEDGLPGNANNALDSILPQPLADDSIKQEVSGLFTMIDGHVVNYYHEEPLGKPTPAIKDTFLPAAVSSQKNVTIDQLLVEPRTRSSAISSIICGKLLENVNLSSDTKRTLLPSVFTYFLHSLVSQPDTSHAAQLSLSRWRVSSMFLRGSQPLAGEQEHWAQAVCRITEDLDQILAPYVAPEDATRRVKDLEMLCERATEMGIMILSQPARWEFTWRLPSRYRAAEQRGGTRGTRTPLVMFPGLVRTTDNSARVLDRPRSFIDPRVQS